MVLVLHLYMVWLGEGIAGYLPGAGGALCIWCTWGEGIAGYLHGAGVAFVYGVAGGGDSWLPAWCWWCIVQMVWLDWAGPGCGEGGGQPVLRCY